MSSSTKTTLFLCVLSLMLMITGQALAERQGLLLGFLLSVGINSFVYFYGHSRFDQMFAGRELEGQDPWAIQKSVLALSQKLKIPPPKIIMVPFPTPTAMAIGRSHRSAKIYLSENIVYKLNHDELIAVLANELVKIKRLDTFAFTVSSAISYAFLQFANTLDYALEILFGKLKKNKGIFFFHNMMAPLAATIVRASTTQNMFFEADKLAAELIQNPMLMARVIWKLKSYSATKPLPVSPDTAHLFIVNPLAPTRANRYFQTHPSIDARVKNLVGYFPI